MPHKSKGVKLCDQFGGQDSEMYNALMTAFHECSNDADIDFYNYIESTPKTTLIVNLVDKLKEIGFIIVATYPLKEIKK